MTENHIKFSTIREDFNEYKIENSLILRVKPILMDIIQQTKDNETGFNVVFEKVSKVIRPVEKDPIKIFKEGESHELQFVPVNEVINLYETNTMIILVGYHVDKIFSTIKNDAPNTPPDIFASDNTLFNVVEKPVRSKID
jgi:hypothetical protein